MPQLPARAFAFSVLLTAAVSACSGTGDGAIVAEDDAESALNGVSITLTEHTMESTSTNWATSSQVVDRQGSLDVWLASGKLPTDGYDVGFVKAKVDAGVLVLTAAPLAPPTGCATNAFPTKVSAWYAVAKPAGVTSTRVEWAPSAQKRRSGSSCDRFAGTPRIGWATPLPRVTLQSYVSALAAEDESVVVHAPYDLWSIAPDGAVRWHTEKTGNTDSMDVALDATQVYAACDGLCAYRRSDGVLAWRVAATVWTSSPARGADGTLYVASDALLALSSTGTTKWTKQIAGYRFRRPLVRADGTIVAMAVKTDGTEDRLYALRPDGTEAWMTPFAHPQQATLRLVRLLTTSPDGTVYLDTPAGVAENDLTRVSATGVAAPAFARSNAFAVPTPDGGLLTAGTVTAQKTAANGALAWWFDAAPPVRTNRWSAKFAPPVVDALGHVHLAASSINSDWSPLVELDAAGKQVSSIQVDDWQSAIAVTPKRQVYSVGSSVYGVVTHTP